MNTIDKLILDVSIARKKYIDQIEHFTQEQAQWKPAADSWSMVEITEHLFWAEQGGILGMWKSILAIREGKMERTYDSIHRDMPIEQIVKLTWQLKEKVPAMAAPRLGGPLSFWCNSLSSLQAVLKTFACCLKNDELRLQAHPHPISGPLDFQQRFEFLTFHINRHRDQISWLIGEMGTT
jgi:DinB superfamily